MKLKFIKFVVISVLAVFILSACAQMQQTQTVKSASPVIDRILKKKELVVGTAGSMPPLNMTTKDGELIGYEIDLAKLIAKAMGVKPKFITKPFSELLPALQSGEVDMVISGMTITASRNLKFAFVGPYFISGKAFLTKVETIAEAKDAAEVNSPNTRLAALKGSTSQAFVEEIIPKAELFTTKDYQEAVDMVLNDKVHAMVADYPICVVSVFRYPNAGLLSIITPLTYEPLGIAIPPGDPLMVNWLENLLNNLDESGYMDELQQRWFEGGSWLKKLP